MSQKEFFVSKSETVTPSDSDDLTSVGRGILVDVAGFVKVSYADGTTDTVALVGAVWHAMIVARVWATGTDATGIHVGW